MIHCHVGLTGPTYRAASLWDPRVSLSFERWFSTTLKIKSTPLLKVSLIQGSRIDAAPIYITPDPPEASSEVDQKFLQLFKKIHERE
jgi:hypothetical protein